MQKLSSLSLVAVAAMTLMGCSQEDTVSPSVSQKYSAVVENEPSTRSYNAGNGVFRWSAGDDIAVYTSDNGFQTMKMVGGADTQEASYEGVMGRPADVAVFPVKSATSYSDATLTINYPNSYTVEGSGSQEVDDPLVAYFNQGETRFVFRHVGGVIVWNVAVPAGVDAFEVTMKSAVTGDFIVNATDKDAPTVATSGTANNVVTFNFEKTTEAKEMHFYMPVPTGTYTGFTLTLRNNGEKVGSFSSTASNTVNRCTWLNMPLVTINNYTGVIEQTVVKGVEALNTLLSSGENLKTKSVYVDLNGETLTNSANELALTAKTLTLTNGTVSQTRLKLTATDGITLKNLKIDGKQVAKGNACISLNSNGEVYVSGLDYSTFASDGSKGKNLLEINLTKGVLADKVTVKDSKFMGNTNNSILVFGMPEGGLVTVDNCEFSLPDGGEAVRISNKSASKAFTVNVSDCNYTYPDTEADSNKMWNGFFIFEDYTDANALTTKPFAGLTVNCKNVSYKGTVVTAVNAYAENRSQFACIVYDEAETGGSKQPTGEGHLPQINFLK